MKTQSNPVEPSQTQSNQVKPRKNPERPTKTQEDSLKLRKTRENPVKPGNSSIGKKSFNDKKNTHKNKPRNN